MEYTNKYDNTAEEWENMTYSKVHTGGGGALKKKKNLSTVGRKREGGTQPWGIDKSRCRTNCKMKCCLAK
jgi:hypothetical protein